MDQSKLEQTYQMLSAVIAKLEAQTEQNRTGLVKVDAEIIKSAYEVIKDIREEKKRKRY